MKHSLLVLHIFQLHHAHVRKDTRLGLTVLKVTERSGRWVGLETRLIQLASLATGIPHLLSTDSVVLFTVVGVNGRPRG